MLQNIFDIYFLTRKTIRAKNYSRLTRMSKFKNVNCRKNEVNKMFSKNITTIKILYDENVVKRSNYVI